MQINNRVRHERPQLRARSQISLVHFLIIDRLGAERAKHRIVFAVFGLQFFREQPRLHQVRDPQPGPRRLVRVSRTDAAFGRSDFGVAFSQFALLVERAVIRQHQVRAIAHQKILTDFDPDATQLIDFIHHRDWIDHDAVADHANFSTAQNS